MSHDGRGIANFILDVCDELGRDVTNLSLQKLVFFCHAWYMVRTRKPLIKHQFEAWQFGPVLQYLYREFKPLDREPIRERCKKINLCTGKREVVQIDLSPEESQFLREVVSFYSKLSAGTLVELSHTEGGPWHNVWNHEGHVNPGMKISDASILDFYSSVPIWS